MNAPFQVIRQARAAYEAAGKVFGEGSPEHMKFYREYSRALDRAYEAVTEDSSGEDPAGKICQENLSQKNRGR